MLIVRRVLVQLLQPPCDKMIATKLTTTDKPFCDYLAIITRDTILQPVCDHNKRIGRKMVTIRTGVTGVYVTRLR